MANSGGKNVILIIIAIGAIGGAVYFLTSMGEENPQDEQMVYFIDPESVLNDPQDVVALTTADFAKRRNDVLLSSAEADDRREFAGQCPHCDKFFALIGHSENPDNCPVCKEELE
jgi:hypothetical protein